MALGNILREAREACGLSTTEVAEHTNMMVQIVEELEKEDFHRIAAPIYGRGFLKLYAELVKIEVQPLIEEFMDIYTGKTVPSVQRKENASSEIKRPVPIAAPEVEEQQESEAPHRVEIVPRRAVRNIEGAPKPLSQQDVPIPQPSERDSVEINAPEPVMSSAPLAEEPAHIAPTVIAEPEVQTDVADDTAEPQPPELSAEIPPEPGDNLFGADEPNLFNSTPLQERIAEARRVMDEKEDAKKEDNKKASLHLSTNQRLPVFQIGGRMDKTYETKPRKEKNSGAFSRFASSLLRTVEEFFRQFRVVRPVKMSSGNRKIFVYGAFGVIIFAFLISGLMLIFKLTKPVNNAGSVNEKPPSVIAESVKKPVNPSPRAKHEIPPPPDMYFD